MFLSLILIIWSGEEEWRITKLNEADPDKLIEDRKGQVDKHCTFVTFRNSRLRKKDMLTLVNEFDKFLAKRGMIVDEFYKITEKKVAVWTPQLSDMMELKQIAPQESMVYIVESGGETKLGAFITDQEKDEYYKQFQTKSKKGRKRRKKRKDPKNNPTKDNFENKNEDL